VIGPRPRTTWIEVEKQIQGAKKRALIDAVGTLASRADPEIFLSGTRRSYS